jgi:hypothetical protein
MPGQVDSPHPEGPTKIMNSTPAMSRLSALPEGLSASGYYKVARA